MVFLIFTNFYLIFSDFPPAFVNLHCVNVSILCMFPSFLWMVFFSIFYILLIPKIESVKKPFLLKITRNLGFVKINEK